MTSDETVVAKLLPLREGDFLDCPRCGGRHLVTSYAKAPMVLTTRCEGTTYLAGMQGRRLAR